MSAKQTSVVVGVFEDRLHADQAVSELRKAGFRQDQIGVAMRHVDGVADAATDTTDGATETHAESGALTGALTGLGLGALAGLGVLAGVIPIVGPAIAAGTLGVLLSNAAVGAGVVGLVGALMGAGIPEHEAKYYQGELEAGRAIVTVHADSRATEATTILRRFGAYDMTSRGDVATATSTTTRAAVATAPSTARATTGRSGETIEVKEERLHAEKTAVPAGEVRVRKEVHTETKTIDVPVQREEVVIERTPIHGRATADSLRAGEEIRIPVSEEKIRVTKEAVVTEEVKVGKRVVQDTERVSGQVRKEEIKVEQTGDVDVRTRGKN